MDPAQAAARTNATAISNLPAPTAHVPVMNPFVSNQFFDLATHTCNDAFNTISKPLDKVWDGTVESSWYSSLNSNCVQTKGGGTQLTMPVS